jgi:GTPase SAR1 family protein
VKDSSTRLHLFTGKGGVGKSCLSLSYALWRWDQNKTIKYCFYQGQASEWDIQQFPFPSQEIDIQQAIKEYVTLKLGSKVIAGWICQTKIFKTISEIVPAFSYLIFLGKLVHELKNDPELEIIVDFPATGHALSFLESMQNFKSIFGAGLLVKDIEEMVDLCLHQHWLKLYIITTPAELPLKEAREFIKELEQGKGFDYQCIMNAVYNFQGRFHNDQLPSLLQNRFQDEAKYLKEAEDLNPLIIPFSMEELPRIPFDLKNYWNQRES